MEHGNRCNTHFDNIGEPEPYRLRAITETRQLPKGKSPRGHPSDCREAPRTAVGTPKLSRIPRSPPFSYIEIIRFANNIACDEDEAQNLVLINFEYSFLNDVIKENAKNEK